MPESTTNPRPLRAQTVTGLVDGDALGITLPHEHVLIDMSVWFVEPAEAESKAIAHQPVSLGNLGWIMFNQYNNLDNVRLLDEALAIEECGLFKKRGGGTIVDVTSIGLTRNAPALRRVAEATGLNIIAGCGYYVLPGERGLELDAKSIDEVVAEIVSDLTVGIDGSDVRAGIIGEIGCSWPLQEREKKVLTSAAIAQRETGAAITIHPGRGEDSPLEIIDWLAAAGADVSRVIMGHIDRTGFKLETRRRIAATGCYLEYDIFGGNPFYPLHFGVFNRPGDRERIEQVKALIDEGFGERVLISQDVCLKTKLVKYGGQGYSHILNNIVPQMLARGITEADISTMMVDNPRRLLCFA